MPKEKKQYVAVHAITFEGLKGKPYVKEGDLIPENVDEKTIKDLLEHGDIQEVE